MPWALLAALSSAGLNRVRFQGCDLSPRLGTPSAICGYNPTRSSGLCDHEAKLALLATLVPCAQRREWPLPIYFKSFHPMKVLALALVAIIIGQAVALGQTIESPEASASQNPLYFGALPWELADDAEEMIVHSVTDGDTVRLTYPTDDWYYNTRLIGIQAPEMDGPYTEEGCYGPEAKEFLTELLPIGSVVFAQQDVSNEDTNGRRLRHVFLIDEDTGEAFLVSEILVLGGFAEARSYPPDDLYDDVLQEAEELAQDEDDGLWDACSA